MDDSIANTERTTNENKSASLFSQMCSMDILGAAWSRVRSNRGSAGSDNVSLEEYEAHLEENLAALRQDLLSGVYQPQPLVRFWVTKPSGGKRPLAIPTVRDRVTQTAAAIVVTPLLDREFEDASFGFRRGRSVQQAVDRVECLFQEGYRWVVDADIESFFDEVSHEILLRRIRESIAEEKVIRLMARWIAAPVRDGGKTVCPTKGLPQGSPISPVLANLYLDRFDEEVLRKGFRLVRFADDFLILCKTKPQAEAALELSEETLTKLRLSLDADKTRITNFGNGFRYLGNLFLGSIAIPSPQRGLPEDAPTQNHRMPSAPALPMSSQHDSTDHCHSETLMGQTLRVALEEAEEGRTALQRVRSSNEAGTSGQISQEHNGVSEPPRLSEEPGVRADDNVASPRAFRHTLYIQEQGSVLARRDERLQIRKDETVLLEVPAAKVDQIFVFGRCTITTPAMTFCLQRSIPIVLLSSKGNYYGMIDSPLADRVSLQQRQFQRAADSSFTLVTGKGLVRAKLANCRVLLQRHQRRRKLSAVQEVIVELESLSTRLGDAQTLDEVRGFEGRGAASYFEALGHLLVKNPGFDHRARRPPTDPVNSLLSFGYTLCFYNIFALIRARGLHPGVGFLHALRDGHPGLASDLLEEFRAPIVDGLVLQLFNTCAIKPTDFYRPSGPEPRPCLLRDPARKIFLEYFERRMVSSLIHPRTKESLDWRRVMDVQVAHMVQWIRGEVTEYLPLEIR